MQSLDASRPPDEGSHQPIEGTAAPDRSPEIERRNVLRKALTTAAVAGAFAPSVMAASGRSTLSPDVDICEVVLGPDDCIKVSDVPGTKKISCEIKTNSVAMISITWTTTPGGTANFGLGGATTGTTMINCANPFVGDIEVNFFAGSDDGETATILVIITNSSLTGCTGKQDNATINVKTNCP